LFDNADQDLRMASSTCWYGCSECKVSRLLVKLTLSHYSIRQIMLNSYTVCYVREHDIGFNFVKTLFEAF
jgi:hypothetical protein